MPDFLKSYLLRNAQVLLDTLGRMSRAPLPTLLTVGVLAIAIALPLVLYQIAESLNEVVGDWRGEAEISVFLDEEKLPDDIDTAAVAFAQTLLQMPAVSAVRYISKTEALIEFRRTSGFGGALDGLPENPLPPLLLVSPRAQLSPHEVRQLAADIARREEVDAAEFAQDWLQRLAAILQLLRRGVGVLAGLMTLGAVLIIGDAARVNILQRRAEIEIVAQVGGTRAFIRRPFVYAGVLHGAFGALAGYAVAALTLALLAAPVARLARLYDSDFHIHAIGGATLPVALAGAMACGWLAARLAVGRHLSRAENNPSFG